MAYIRKGFIFLIIYLIISTLHYIAVHCITCISTLQLYSGFFCLSWRVLKCLFCLRCRGLDFGAWLIFEFCRILEIYNICENLRVPWIVVKAISDWADGTKDKKWQPFAGAVAASFVKHVLTKNYIPDEPKRKSGMCNYVVCF